MPKQKARYDGLDVAAATAHVRRSLLGHKVANVYDGAALSASSETSGARSTYVFKLANPNASSSSSSSAAAAENASKGGGGGDDAGNADRSDQPSSNRAMLLVESGVRFHATTYAASSTAAAASSAGDGGGRSMPSPFAAKLRKHLRNLRLENATQLGHLDRVVDFRFGSGGAAHHLLLELYAQGNLILCDAEYRILALLRTHEYGKDDDNRDATNAAAGGGGGGATGREGGQVKVRVGSVYPVTYATTLGSAAAARGGDDADDEDGRDGDAGDGLGLLSMDGPAACEWAQSEMEAWRARMVESAEEQERLQQQRQQQKQQQSGKGGKGKKGGGGGGSKKSKKKDQAITLKALLLKPTSGVYHFGPSLIEHCILRAGLGPNVKLTPDVPLEEVVPVPAWSGLVAALQEEGLAVVDGLVNGDGGGYVLYRPKKEETEGDEGADDEKKEDASSPAMPHSDKIFEEFQPHLLMQHAGRPHIRYPTFSSAVDEFFSLIEGQKRALRAEAAEAAAKEKLEKIRRDQANRLEALERDMERMKENAQLVEANAEDVDKALLVINSAMSSGMDWEALESLVEVEQRNGNPIAMLVKKLDLGNDAVVLALPDILNYDGSDGEAIHTVDITISLKDSAFGNARNMFEKYRSAKDKSQKTIEASTKALKAAEATAQRQLEEAQKRKVLTTVTPQRKQHWFEKFNYMITSDNYLVVGGKDAQQNEQLVKRYLRPGDAYLHADVHGAASVILRAKRRRTPSGKTEVLPLSDQALREAGNFTICRSSAWASKMVTSAWWVESHQVSKTAPTGEYLTVGSFMIRGKKNFLPASQLEMGIGVLFRLGDEASIARHANDRRDFALLERETSLADDDDENLGSARTNPKVSSKVEPSSNYKNQTVDGENAITSTEEKKEVESDSDDANEHENGGGAPAKKGISARERKLMRKGQSSAEVSEKDSQSKPVKENKANQPKKKQESMSRGKKAKMKRAAKKYQDQDDEDRELAMLALHGGEKRSRKKGKGSRQVEEETSTQLKAASEAAELLMKDASKVADKLSDDIRETLASCVTVEGAGDKDAAAEPVVRWDKFDADTLEQLVGLESEDEQLAAAKRLLELNNSTRIDNYSASLAGIIRAVKKYGAEHFALANEGDGTSDGKQRKTKAEKDAEKEAWRQILAEDGILDEEADVGGEIDDRAEIGKLTGTPHGNDVILYALPICAPYSTLSKYKYRVKLTPGSLKRGKASKQAVEMFVRGDTDKSPKAEEFRRLIKAVDDNTWVQSMIGDCKISAAGASKISKQIKQKKKGGSKKKK